MQCGSGFGVQLKTVLSWFVQVALVLVGILTRGSGGGGSKAGGAQAPAGQHFGYIAILGAALGYATLGIGSSLAVFLC
jgi:hypothetical protein